MMRTDPIWIEMAIVVLKTHRHRLLRDELRASLGSVLKPSAEVPSSVEGEKKKKIDMRSHDGDDAAATA